MNSDDSTQDLEGDRIQVHICPKKHSDEVVTHSVQCERSPAHQKGTHDTLLVLSGLGMA